MIDLLKTCFKYFRRTVLYIIYILSGFSPRSKQMWIFGDFRGEKFGDNSKYLFLYVCQHEPQIKAIWLSTNKEVIKYITQRGYRAYHKWSLRGIIYSLRAKYGFYTHFWLDDVNSIFVKNAKKIYLTHGIPLKKILFDDKIKKQKESFYDKIFNLLINIKPDFVTITSEIYCHIFASATQINPKQIFITGYPRNDCLFQRTGKKHFKRMILYAPTYRDGNFNPFDHALAFDKYSLLNVLKDLRATLAIKFHPLTCEKEFKSISNDKEIVILPRDLDIYEILDKFYIFITDYSSIYFDFLLLNRPIIFFPFDYQTYITEEKELYFDYYKMTPGPKVYNWKELEQELVKNFKHKQDDFLKERKRVLDLVHQYKDAKASERITNLIKCL